MVDPIPQGFHTVTPYLRLREPAKAIEFYSKAFGAEERFRMPGPAPDQVMHAEIKIGDSIIMLSGEWPDHGCLGPQSLNGTTVSIHLYVKDADASFKKAVDAGAKPTMPPADMFWGDRFAKILDPFGHEWSFATHKEDLTPEQMAERQKAWIAQQKKG